MKWRWNNGLQTSSTVFAYTQDMPSITEESLLISKYRHQHPFKISKMPLDLLQDFWTCHICGWIIALWVPWNVRLLLCLSMIKLNLIEMNIYCPYSVLLPFPPNKYTICEFMKTRYWQGIIICSTTIMMWTDVIVALTNIWLWGDAVIFKCCILLWANFIVRGITLWCPKYSEKCFLIYGGLQNKMFYVL